MHGTQLSGVSQSNSELAKIARGSLLAYLQASCNDKLCCVVVLMCYVVERLRCSLFYLCVVVRVICVALCALFVRS